MIGLFRKRKTISRRMLHLNTMPAAIYAVGDIHGRFDLYERLERQIIQDAVSIEGPKLLILLGDIVDRSTGVSWLIDHLLAPDPEGFKRITLCGCCARAEPGACPARGLSAADEEPRR